MRRRNRQSAARACRGCRDRFSSVERDVRARVRLHGRARAEAARARSARSAIRQGRVPLSARGGNRRRSRGRRTGTSSLSSINRPARCHEPNAKERDERCIARFDDRDRYNLAREVFDRTASERRVSAMCCAAARASMPRSMVCVQVSTCTDRGGGSDRLMTHAAMSISLIRIRSMRRNRLASTVRSAVPSANRLMACTVRVWPMRSTRPMRCSRRIGFHGSSRLTTSLQVP